MSTQFNGQFPMGHRQWDNKKRVNAFTGNELEMILRANSISHLALTGVATGGIVLSTLTEAFDKDYQLTVIADCCADPDEKVHQFLLDKVFSKRGAVVTFRLDLKHLCLTASCRF